MATLSANMFCTDFDFLVYYEEISMSLKIYETYQKKYIFLEIDSSHSNNNDSLSRIGKLPYRSNFNKCKEEGKDQASIQSSTTPNPGHHTGMSQKHIATSHTREQRGQSFPSWSSHGCKKQTRQTQISRWINKKALPWNGQKKILEGLNMFNDANHTLNSDVDQDTCMSGSH